MNKKLKKRTTFRKKKKCMGKPDIISPEKFEESSINVKVELIQSLIPIGLMHISELLQEEVNLMAGERYKRSSEPYKCVRYGSNPGSVKLASQRIPITVPRLRNIKNNCEIPLETMKLLRKHGELDEQLFNSVFNGISCRNFKKAAQEVPGAIGLSSSTISRRMIESTEEKLSEFQERDLSSYDFVSMWIDGKTFADDMLVVAMGLTMDGYKMPMGFVQTGTENKMVISKFLRDLINRGLDLSQGLLVVIDGAKGLYTAVKEVFQNRVIIQRCQFHKRENIVSYLPKEEQENMKKCLQEAYEHPSYKDAKAALMKIKEELRVNNLSAMRSLNEGLEDTLSLHKLGLFDKLGISLKTTNCIESVFSMVGRTCKRISNWKNSSQKHRWMATCLLDIETRMRRVRGYKHLSLLRERIKNKLGIKEVNKGV